MLYWILNKFINSSFKVNHVLLYSVQLVPCELTRTVLTLTDDIRLPFSLGEKRKLRAARGSGITATMLTMTGEWARTSTII